MGCGLNRGKSIKIIKKTQKNSVLMVERIHDDYSSSFNINEQKSNSLTSSKFEPKASTRDNSGDFQKQIKSKILCSKISQNNWINVIDFLNFKELKEVGKINKYFNYLARQDRVLVKFFSKKRSKNYLIGGKNIIYISLN